MLGKLDNKNIELGVFIKIPDRIVSKITNFNKLIGDINKTNNIIHNIYHISLAQGVFKIADVGLICKEIEKIAKSSNNFLVELYSQPVIAGNNIFLDAVKKSELIKLEKSIMSVVKKYRNGLMMQFCDLLDKPNSLPSELKDEIQRVGVPNSGKYYRPHITIYYNVFAKGKIADLLPILNLENSYKEFPVSSISIGELGYHGNAINILKDFQF